MVNPKRLTYTVGHEAWHWRFATSEGATHEIGVHADADNWELFIRWYDLGSGPAAPRLEIFDEAWVAFNQFPELFAFMAANASKRISTDDVTLFLVRLGLTDETSRIAPTTENVDHVCVCHNCGQEIQA